MTVLPPRRVFFCARSRIRLWQAVQVGAGVGGLLGREALHSKDLGGAAKLGLVTCSVSGRGDWPDQKSGARSDDGLAPSPPIQPSPTTPTPAHIFPARVLRQDACELILVGSSRHGRRKPVLQSAAACAHASDRQQARRRRCNGWRASVRTLARRARSIWSAAAGCVLYSLKSSVARSPIWLS